MSLLRSAIAGFACCLATGIATSAVQAEGEQAEAERAGAELAKTEQEMRLTRRDSRTITGSTAWIPDAGQVNLELGLDQEQRPTGSATVGLGDIAEFGLVLQHERSVCDPCEDVDSDAMLLNVSSAFFKMGTPEGMGHKHVPALALIFRKSLHEKAQLLTDAERVFSKAERETRGATLTAMASKTLGSAAVHLGAELLVADGGDEREDLGVGKAVIRPALGLQWTPSKYPLSTFLIDLRWVPVLFGEDESDLWSTRMTAAWGVRYQALDWASVDLNVRGQEGQGLGDALVTLGVRGQFDLND